MKKRALNIEEKESDTVVVCYRDEIDVSDNGDYFVQTDGYIFDFGGDFRGDMIALLQEYHGMNFPQAVEYVAECLGVKL